MYDYQEYLESFEWQTTKERILLKRGKVCQVCSSQENIHIHHLTYERLGCEKDEDLLVLCEVCHTKEYLNPFVVRYLQRRTEQADRKELEVAIFS